MKCAAWLLGGILLLFVAVAAKHASAGDLYAVAPPAGDAFEPDTLRSLQPTALRFPWIVLADRPLGSLSTAYTNVSVTTPRRASGPVSDRLGSTNLDNNWKSPVYTSGEVGFLYGHSVGNKHSFDTEQGYIFGTVGNDNIQISVGAAYQQWNVRGWRGR